MDEIELVVKIPKEEYEMIVNSEDCVDSKLIFFRKSHVKSVKVL